LGVEGKTKIHIHVHFVRNHSDGVHIGNPTKEYTLENDLFNVRFVGKLSPDLMVYNVIELSILVHYIHVYLEVYHMNLVLPMKYSRHYQCAVFAVRDVIVLQD
jgi:hypothetical protein